MTAALARALTEPAGPGKNQELTLGGADLIAALIGHCRSCSILVPLKGSKVLERFGSQLGLVITIARQGSTSTEKLKR